MKTIIPTKNDIENIVSTYTPFSEIPAEMERRRNDPVLMAKVEELFKEVGLPCALPTPRAFFSPSIATPNLETQYFLDLARDLSLPPCFLECPGAFVTVNKNKYHAGMLYFYTDKEKRAITSGQKLVDFDLYQGEQIMDVKTVTGDSLLDFHHELLYMYNPSLRGSIINFNDWFIKVRDLDLYYFYYLALFVCHGVLFENFLQDDSHETPFILNKVLPSFNRVCEVLGVRPLICPLLPFEHENDIDWLAYPEVVKNMVEEKLHIKIT